MNVLCTVTLAFAISCGGPAPTPASRPAKAPDPPVGKLEAPKPFFPPTHAGKTLGAWFEAFNSGDEARIKEFAATYKYPAPDELVALREQTGGFELVALAMGWEVEARFVVKEKKSATQVVGWLRVKDADPAAIEMFELEAVPPGMTAEQMTIAIDAATRTRVIDAIATRLNKFYVDPDLAKKMEQAVREHAKQGDYDAIVTGPEFAQKLTDDLRAVSHDRHLSVTFAAQVQADIEIDSDEDKARMKKLIERVGCGFEKAERLDGNIGYVKLDMFAPVDVCGPKATAALASLGDVDALIFDLRENGGGQPEMVAFVASYLFGKRTHLNDIYDRAKDKTTEYWTKPDVPGTKYAKQPVYVLTSAKTFSGAEGFSYALQNTKRATIVGEVTGGGAHPTMMRRLDDHFAIARSAR